MTFLDDYQVPYKLIGVQMVNMLLEHVPRDILKRTGVDGLIITVNLLPRSCLFLSVS